MTRRQAAADFWLVIIPGLFILVFAVGLIALILRLATLSDEAAGTVVVVFPTTVRSAAVFDAIVQAEGRLVNNTLLDSIWVVHSGRRGFVGRLKSRGAWRVFDVALFKAISAPGCFNVVPRSAISL